MSEVTTIYGADGSVTILADGTYFYIDYGAYIEKFDCLEDARDVAMSR